MGLTKEQEKSLKIFAMGCIMTGLAINLYLLWNSGKETIATSSLVRPALETMVR